MNVDEAMAYVRSMKPQSVLTFKYEAVIHTLADEVARLRAELAAAKAFGCVDGCKITKAVKEFTKGLTDEY